MTDDQFEEMMTELRNHSDLLERICHRLEDLSPTDYSSDLDSINKTLTHMDNNLGYIEINTQNS